MILDRVLARLTQIPGARTLWQQMPVGSVENRVRFGIFDRPHYAYGVYSAADLARRLGLQAISVVEFGVAGGAGLVALESIARTVADSLGIGIHVAGFDTGAGMPPPLDYRDLPHVWSEGFYRMDVARLRAKLAPETELVLGEIGETVASWKPKAPVGFVAFDLDYYSSTKNAFRLFDQSDSGARLPRVYCYFDDLMWPEHACHNPWVGELCAIREFNENRDDMKLCPIHMLRHMRVHPAAWNDAMYALHDFQHPLYCRNITPQGVKHTQIPL